MMHVLKREVTGKLTKEDKQTVGYKETKSLIPAMVNAWEERGYEIKPKVYKLTQLIKFGQFGVEYTLTDYVIR